jgi:hypothetical protein
VWDDLLHILYVHGVGNDLVASCLVKLAQSHAFGFSPGLPKGAIVPPELAPEELEDGQQDVKMEDVKEEGDGEEEAGGEEDELAPAAAGVKWVREMDDQLRRGYMLFRNWCRKEDVAAPSRLQAYQ